MAVAGRYCIAVAGRYCSASDVGRWCSVPEVMQTSCAAVAAVLLLQERA
jgi:hypothetical protein